MNQTAHQKTDLPLFLRWSAALLSTVGMLALSCCIIVIAAQVRKELAYRDLAQALKSSNYYAGEKKLSVFLSDLRLTNWLSQKIGETNDLSITQRNETLYDLYDIINMLAQGSFEIALQRFNTLRDGQLLRLLWAMPRNRENAQRLGELQKDFTLYHVKMKKLEKLTTERPPAAAENKKQIQQQVLLAKSLAKELTDLFSLPLIDLPSRDSNISVEFYDKGLLVNLPRLPALPDEIEDLVGLKHALERAGGEVTIKGSDAPRRFKEKLEALKAGSAAVRAKLDGLNTEELALSEELSAQKRDVFSSGSALEEQLKNLLLEVCKPDPNLAARFLIGWITGKA